MGHLLAMMENSVRQEVSAEGTEADARKNRKCEKDRQGEPPG
jgi:hypothetical protein